MWKKKSKILMVNKLYIKQCSLNIRSVERIKVLKLQGLKTEE